MSRVGVRRVSVAVGVFAVNVSGVGVYIDMRIRVSRVGVGSVVVRIGVRNVSVPHD